MSKINASTLVAWKDGDVITATKYKQEREIIVTSNNDNDDKIENRYTKAQIDAFLLNLFGPARTTETIMGNRASILDLYATRYSKIEADALLLGKQTQIDQNKEDIRIIYRDKLNITGDFKGTWNGVTLGNASQAINGGRLDVLEPKVSKIQADLYYKANSNVQITHNLLDTPLVHAIGYVGFGYGGFGLFGFGDSKVAYPNTVEYVSDNSLIVYFDEPLGTPTVTPINSRLYTVAFDSGITLTVKLI